MAASCGEIKRAYRKLARTYHPDVVVGMKQKENSANEFMKIHSAYSTLSDPNKRAQYDRAICRHTRLCENDITISSSSYHQAYPQASHKWETDQCCSNSVKIKRNNGGFWKIGKLFRKKKEKDRDCERSVNGGGFDERSDTWMADHGGISRSRSLCNFRNGGLLFESEDGRDSILSGARSSISVARSSGVNAGLVMDSGRRNGYSEAEPRRSGFDGEKKDSFMEVDGGGGIYGLDFSSDSKPEFPTAAKLGSNNLEVTHSKEATQQRSNKLGSSKKSQIGCQRKDSMVNKERNESTVKLQTKESKVKLQTKESKTNKETEKQKYEGTPECIRNIRPPLIKQIMQEKNQKKARKGRIRPRGNKDEEAENYLGG
ncbi:acylamino-acid-releasing enzyme [Senna tora]|uniref:Acylamino-acid-releasing enzyme n=1 Tax=Senna tora TaxID=362788 RepID=A0A834XB28_9FABA|nr:acylamino-acid-releasing enzyme [Senna tora]